MISHHELMRREREKWEEEAKHEIEATDKGL